MNKEMMSGMMYGLVTVVAILLTASFIVSLLLRFTDLTESSFATVTLIISLLALFLGGLISGRKANERGWMIGAGTGLLYTILIFLVQFLGFDSGFTMQQYMFFALYIVMSALGGIIGVNLTGDSRKA